jgi:hypothetical protein
LNDIIRTMGDEFTGDKYHLVNKNCNHFSSALIQVCFQYLIILLPKIVHRTSIFTFRSW